MIIIGYGNDISEEDAQLFTDITKKHRSNTEVFIYQSSDKDIIEELNKINFAKAGGYL